VRTGGRSAEAFGISTTRQAWKRPSCT
jgi:hypothetical protein